MGAVISILNLKGGIGKTASFVNIAARIAMDMPIFPRGIKCGIFGTKKVDPRLKI